jgi:hypothetical protein
MAVRWPAHTEVNGMVGNPNITRHHDFEAEADEALAIARDMPPGPERIDALKKAGHLRNAADTYGLVFATRGRPSNG